MIRLVPVYKGDDVLRRYSLAFSYLEYMYSIKKIFARIVLMMLSMNMRENFITTDIFDIRVRILVEEINTFPMNMKRYSTNRTLHTHEIKFYFDLKKGMRN